MQRRIFVRVLAVVSLLSMGLACQNVQADEGQPIAVRQWPGGMLSIETQWGLNLVLNPNASALELLGRAPSQVVELGTDEVDHILDRLPNVAEVTWAASGEAKPTPNAIHVQSLATGAVSVSVDGLRLVVAKQSSLASLAKQEAASDLAVLMAEGNVRFDSFEKILTTINARQVLLVVEDAKAAGLVGDFTAVPHNTFSLAKSASKKENEAAPKVTVLSSEPWKMPADLEELFAKMEASCRASQQVFSKLSVAQMNFKPSNGTHTPRWNTEHMMGRQLGFFSQIYNAIDPTIPVMNLNPKQMPEDYEYAHASWNGAEEARQMQRVSDFTRRFAYLLDGQELDKQAPGSRWPSLRALLEQMHRHYAEHTANTVKKFDLPDWPEE